MGEVIDMHEFKRAKMAKENGAAGDQPAEEHSVVNESSTEGKTPVVIDMEQVAAKPERMPIYINPEDMEWLLDECRYWKKQGDTVGEIKSRLAGTLSAAMAARQLGHDKIDLVYKVKKELLGGGLRYGDVSRNHSVYDAQGQLSNLSLADLIQKLSDSNDMLRNTKPAYFGLMVSIIERKIANEFDPGDELIDSIYNHAEI